MRSVTRFEERLLQLLHALLGESSSAGFRRFLLSGAPRPSCLGADAVLLIEDSLAKGCVKFLVWSGGWQRKRFLNQGRTQSGRLWERIPTADRQLQFSGQTLELLMTLAAIDFDKDPPASPPPGLQCQSAPTNGDLLLALIAYRKLRSTRGQFSWTSCPIFFENAFCRLFFPADFVDADPVSFADATRTDCGFLWEPLQSGLVREWVELERQKMQIESADRMRQIGHSQLAVAETFLYAIDRAGRRDLARWLFGLARNLFATEVSSEMWIERLNVQGLRMAERIESYRAALVVAQLFQHLALWQGEARTVGYLDEGYQAAQLWLLDWEAFRGDALSQTAQTLLREVEPIS